MIRSFLTVSTGTLASRLLGFARDAMVASLIGAGPVADAFLIAFQFVNIVRRLLTEGALSNALVPVWLTTKDTRGPLAATAFAGRVLGTLSALLIVATGIIGLLMPWVMAVLAPGFADEETLRFAVNDARLMLPYLAFAGPATVTMALLNVQGRFALTAFAPLMFNIALLAVMIALAFRHPDSQTAAMAIAATVGIAGLLQLLILISRGRRFATPLRVAFDRPMRDFFAKALPGMISAAGPQILLVGGAIVASTSPSAVSWLYFASRLIELPLGLVGVAVGAVLLPELTRAVRADDRSAISHAESRGLELAMGLALPAMFGLIALREPVARLLFEHGLFTATDTAGTANALGWLALSLPAQVLIKALSPAFFARGDMAAPLWATLKGFAVAIALAIVLGRLFGTGGIAASIAFGAWSSAWGLIRRGGATLGFAIDATARRRLPRLGVAAVAMGALLWLTAPILFAAGHDPHGPAFFLLVATLISGGVAAYALFLLLLGVISRNDAIGALRKSASSRLRG
ncbi:MAG TPA: murein biosynthesis integral membrane protein MurJ [Bradyrhizobium sp.]|nr:murein biosynthesis integral membrane protein MurJ [Bradyrhizobium sp.]